MRAFCYSVALGGLTFVHAYWLCFALAGRCRPAYTIDFEEFDVGDTGPLISGDYLITGDSDFCASFGPCDEYGQIDDSKGDNYFLVGAPVQPDVGGSARIRVERVDGQAFALRSVGYAPSAVIVGITVDGETASGPIGQGDWLNLNYFFIDSFSPDLFAVAQIDDIVVTSPVPLPAAVWLFGSAIFGLGFFRRAR